MSFGWRFKKTTSQSYHYLMTVTLRGLKLRQIASCYEFDGTYSDSELEAMEGLGRCLGVEEGAVGRGGELYEELRPRRDHPGDGSPSTAEPQQDRVPGRVAVVDRHVVLYLVALRPHLSQHRQHSCTPRTSSTHYIRQWKSMEGWGLFERKTLMSEERIFHKNYLKMLLLKKQKQIEQSYLEKC